MKQLRWKKLKFNEVHNLLNPNKDLHNRFIINELIFMNSKVVKNEIDLIVNGNNLIDFNWSKFSTIYAKITKENYPIQYITKKCYFYNHEFFISKNVFIPRQETEFIFDWMIKNIIKNRTINIVDLCCGSGCLTNSLYLYNKKLKIWGVEKYSAPYKNCLINKDKFKTNVNFIKKDILLLKRNFFSNIDLIFCNPPYIDFDDKDVHISTKYDPKTALFAKEEGYYFYFKILDKYWNFLKSGTEIIFEIGYKQKEILKNKINDLPLLKWIEFVKDIDGNCRILYIKKG